MKGTQFLLATLFIIAFMGIIGFGLFYRETSGIQMGMDGNQLGVRAVPQSIGTGIDGAALACGILASTCITLYVLIDMMLYKEAKKLN